VIFVLQPLPEALLTCLQVYNPPIEESYLKLGLISVLQPLAKALLTCLQVYNPPI
jgi:hypothetical protein